MPIQRSQHRDVRCTTRILRAIKTYGSLAFAARRLHLSQAVVRDSLRALSIRLDGKAVEGTERHLRLTNLAELFLRSEQVPREGQQGDERPARTHA
jgi:hypothetical protein